MHSCSTRPLVIALAAGALLLCEAAIASQPQQPVEPPDLPEPAAEPVVPPGPGEPPPPSPVDLIRERPIVVKLQARGQLGFSADLRNEPGEVTVNRIGTALGVAVPVRQYAQLDFGLDYEFSHYAFRNATSFVPGVDSPWEKIHRETLSLRFSQQQTLRVGWFVGGSLGLAHEEGASLSDSIIGSAYGGVRVAMAENLFIGGGLVFWSQLEDNPLIFPLPGLDWWIHERLRLTSSGQLGATLAYKASDELTFSVGAEYDLREFRLRDRGPAPGGVGRDRRVPLTVGIGYAPTPHLTIDLTAGAYMWQQFRLLNERGDTLAEIDGRPTPFAGLQIGYRF